MFTCKMQLQKQVPCDKLIMSYSTAQTVRRRLQEEEVDVIMKIKNNPRKKSLMKPKRVHVYKKGEAVRLTEGVPLILSYGLCHVDG